VLDEHAGIGDRNPLETDLCTVEAYGTIGLVKDHRVRLTDDDIALIVSALKARAAMTTGLRRHRVERLANRLAEGQKGNPKWVLSDELGQTHEDELAVEDLDS